MLSVTKIMKNKLVAAFLLRAVVFGGVAAVMTPTTARAAAPEKSVVIVANDTLRFNVTKIKASPGQTIHVQLQNKGSVPKAVMGHNWILLDSVGIANSYAMAAMVAAAENYQPKAYAAQVLASIPLLGPKEVGNVTFNAPSQPGHYPFICSFPGHFSAGMRGELIVK